MLHERNLDVCNLLERARAQSHWEATSRSQHHPMYRNKDTLGPSNRKNRRIGSQILRQIIQSEPLSLNPAMRSERPDPYTDEEIDQHTVPEQKVRQSD